MNKHKGQGFVEFVFIIPLLIVLLFGIVELTLFLRAVNVVEIIATEASVVASHQIVKETDSSTDFADPLYNPAVKVAVNKMLERFKTLGIDYDISDFTCTVNTDFGSPPYSKYKFVSTSSQKEVNGTDVDEIVMNVDYTNPYKKGVIVDVSFAYSTLFLAAEFRMPGHANAVNKIVILPKNMQIRSIPIQQFIHY